MKGKGLCRVATALVIALVLFAPVLRAATTVVDVRFGESFTGSIGVVGDDTVQARFFAAQGASVRIAVRATAGSSLRPTVAIKDASGTPLEEGPTQQIGWLPVANLLHYFTVPETGRYIAEIGGSSGSGGFWARISGSPSDVPMSSFSGTVTNGLTGAAIAGVSVLVGDAPFATTNASGSYSGDLPAGSYSVTFQAGGYQPATRSLSLSAGTPAVLNVSLTPLVPVMVDASVSGDAVAGGSLTATVEVLAPPGTTIESIEWTQEYGVAADIAGADTDTATVTLGSEGDFKDELLHVLAEPPIGEDELPPNVPLPEGEFPGGLQNRLQVVGVNPFALEEAALVVLKVEVTTDLGTFSDEVEIHTALPWKVATGLRNVPIGIPVLVQGKEVLPEDRGQEASYRWVLAEVPDGSSATLTDATTRNPYFTPDVPGLYELEVSEGEFRGSPPSTSTLQVYAGTWVGVITDQDMDGRPVADSACTTCHDNDLAPDNFADWVQTGHAEIFTDNLNNSTHYSSSCFPCHTVGYDPEVDNGGIDEAPDYQGFLAAGLLNHPGDNWTAVLEEFPETARLANAQCENCHGPQDSYAHGFAGPLGEPRADLSSDVCATCHGEPLRHARFQQWQLSAHANYELAVDEGEDGSCSRCHTANGFLTWLPILLDDDPETDPADDIFYCGDEDVCIGGANAGESCNDEDDCPPEWTADETHPQTCVTCHDPHAPGTTSGAGTNATVRISGDTPPLIAGFQATDVGRGAICMTCHNSRRGLRNDDTFDGFSTRDKARAPHGSAQTDVLMGQNAYLVEIDDRGGHSFVEDACVVCHMEKTPPPDLLAYNLGGSNHTFYAGRDICSDCHSPHLTADDVQGSVQFLLDQVKDLLEDGLLDLMGELTAARYGIDFDGDKLITDVDDVVAIEFGEFRGTQAITVTFTGDLTLGPYAVTSVDVVSGDTREILGTLYDFADDRLMKAGWNWHLFNGDGSLGVHNPFFASGALIAARDGLVAIPAGMGSPRAVKTGPPEAPAERDGKQRVNRSEAWREAGQGRSGR